MPNKKATRTQIQFPPLLNLANDRPHIDTSLKNFEKQNGPYINDMIFPFYVKSLDSEYVFDRYGKSYHIENNKFYREDLALFAVSNNHFERKDITDRMLSYLCYDVDDTYDGTNITAWATLDEETNKITFHFGDNDYTSEILFAEGTIIRSRIRILDDDALLVIYFDEQDTGYIYYCRMNRDGTIEAEMIEEAQWKVQRCRYLTTTNYTSLLTTLNKEDKYPFICISKLPNNRGTSGYGISLISDFGLVMNSKDYGFISFIDTEGVIYEYGKNLVPDSSSQTAEVTTETSAYFNIYTGHDTNTMYGAFLYKDGHYYEYAEDGVLGEEINFPTTYQPNPTKIDYVTIGDVSYDYGTYNYRLYASTITVATSSRDVEWSFSAESLLDQDVHYSTSDSSYPKSITVERRVYTGQDDSNLNNWRDVLINWMGEEALIEDAQIGRGSFLLTSTTATEQQVSWLVAPNIFLDNGKMYSMWTFNCAAGTWSNSGTADGANYFTMAVGNTIIESAEFGEITVANDIATYKFTPLSYFTVTNDSRCVRGNSFQIGQNFFANWVKLNNPSTTAPTTRQSGTAESTSSRYLEYANSNETDLLYFPGSIRCASTALSYYNYWTSIISPTTDIANGPEEDFLGWVASGYRCQLNNTGWRLLYNTDVSGISTIQGISYTEEMHHMGTLVTPWQSIDEDYIVVGNNKYCIYRATDGTYYQISIEEGAQIQSLLTDRYILVNTTSFWNMYDAKLNKMFHYATDYNGRLFHGSPNASDEPAIDGTLSYIRVTGDCINGNYNIYPRYAVSSILLPAKINYRIDVSYSQVYDSICPETQDTQGIDMYWGSMNKTATNQCKYRATIGPFLLPNQTEKFDLSNTTYQVSTSSVQLSPNIFTKYIDGQGNHDGVVEGNSNYVATYQTAVPQPQFLYNALSETLNQDAFFVLQGQFYGVIDDKIYSLIYSDGVITERDAIVDIRGMQFIGNNPIIAFFWSPSLRSVFSFTGDANLQHLYYASKWEDVLNPKNVYWYDESTQAIYVPTNRGLLVLGSKNTYMFEDWTNVTNVQISEDGVTHITNDGITYNCRYYPEEGYEPKTLHIESSFWGQGSTEVGSIDRFGITLYDPTEEHKATEVTVGTRTITDVTVKSEEKKYKITPDMWDKWSHSVLLNYNPKYIQGQGIRLYIDTDKAIQQITAHVQDRATTQLSHANL